MATWSAESGGTRHRRSDVKAAINLAHRRLGCRECLLSLLLPGVELRLAGLYSLIVEIVLICEQINLLLTRELDR